MLRNIIPKFNIYYQNVRGIRSKVHDVYKNILLTDYKVIVFTETWLNSSISKSEFIDSRYVVYRRDRESSSNSKLEGGGVLIAVSREYSSSRAQNWESCCEDLWVNVSVDINGGKRTVTICAVYLPSPANYERQQLFPR